MKRLYNLSIRKKFAVVIVPLIAVILVFDIFQIEHKYLDYHDALRLNSAILVGIEINHVVHEIQKERSITAGFVSGDGTLFSQKLENQRAKTDSTINQLYLEVDNNNDIDELKELHGTDLEKLFSYLNKIKGIRKSVDNSTVSADESIKYYSEINDVSLNIVNRLIQETRDKHVAEQVHAIIYFLKSKERASLERAFGTKAFTNNHMEYDMYNRYTTLVAEQRAYLDAFWTIVDESFKEFYETTVQGPEVDEVDRLRAILFRNTDLNQNPDLWYRVCSAKIDALKKVEDYMSQTMLTLTGDIAVKTQQAFWLFLLLDILIGGIAFYLMSTIVSNLLENVSTLEAFTRRITSGDLSKKVFIDTRDEIGQYAKTFNIMVAEIKKNRQELEKQRDKANYLYRNIYHVAKVVFENIHQGIFLLDRGFRISRFYSKSTETIFDQKNIAGENFASFMRPLILPRELEALEMFMKHLFNKEMDEDVVNQLNPVEQVKIYTDRDGDVVTKYVRVSFTRIVRRGEIRNIMVTISDETESVLLQQHLDEAEAKKKQESEQVLSILKIDPSVLRGFIHNTKRTLKGISERYEDNDSDDYSRLLEFTAKSIHNAKGNALIIGLKLMGVKFHEIEELIDKLRNRDINAKDFLTILYEVNEADKMLDDMDQMLRKIASIYKTLPSEEQVANNVVVLDSLRDGAEKISRELGKGVALTVNNIGDIVIPEAYLNVFNDVMVQLIRNSVAHGIEQPDVRELSGKPQDGVIEINLSVSEKGELKVEYSDDGVGLELNKITKKAIQRGLITEFEGDQMNESQKIDLIFKEGFSLKDQVDQYAGRGQGMSLIKSLVEEQGGRLDVSFEKGKSFTAVMIFPQVKGAN